MSKQFKNDSNRLKLYANLNLRMNAKEFFSFRYLTHKIGLRIQIVTNALAILARGGRERQRWRYINALIILQTI